MPGTLFFDGDCGMCTRSVYLLLRFDRTGGVRIEPLQGRGTAGRLRVSPALLLDAVRWLDASGAVYSGAEAVNAALSAAFGSRLPLRLYRVRGVGVLQEAVYRWVAAHRHRFPGTTPYCRSHPAGC